MEYFWTVRCRAWLFWVRLFCSRGHFHFCWLTLNVQQCSQVTESDLDLIFSIILNRRKMTGYGVYPYLKHLGSVWKAKTSPDSAFYQDHPFVAIKIISHPDRNGGNGGWNIRGARPRRLHQAVTLFFCSHRLAILASSKSFAIWKTYRLKKDPSYSTELTFFVMGQRWSLGKVARAPWKETSMS